MYSSYSLAHTIILELEKARGTAGWRSAQIGCRNPKNSQETLQSAPLSGASTAGAGFTVPPS